MNSYKFSSSALSGEFVNSEVGRQFHFEICTDLASSLIRRLGNFKLYSGVNARCSYHTSRKEFKDERTCILNYVDQK